MGDTDFVLRRATTRDVPGIRKLVEPFVGTRVLLGKEAVDFYESIQQFRVAVASDGTVLACGALHVLWEDLGEVRTLAVSDEFRGKGLGHSLLVALEGDARELGLSRLFCLTFEVDFFERNGFCDMGSETIDPVLYAELLRSHDEGIAEFLDLARVKPNTLGNKRMVKNFLESS